MRLLWKDDLGCCKNLSTDLLSLTRWGTRSLWEESFIYSNKVISLSTFPTPLSTSVPTPQAKTLWLQRKKIPKNRETFPDVNEKPREGSSSPFEGWAGPRDSEHTGVTPAVTTNCGKLWGNDQVKEGQPWGRILIRDRKLQEVNHRGNHRDEYWGWVPHSDGLPQRNGSEREAVGEAEISTLYSSGGLKHLLNKEHVFALPHTQKDYRKYIITFSYCIKEIKS